MPTVPRPNETPPKAMTRAQIEAIEHHLRASEIVSLEPLEGSTLDEKLGRCDVCHARWIDDFECAVHGHRANAPRPPRTPRP
jgi:hypothetical protein